MNRVVLDTDVASYYSRAWQSDRGALDALKEEWDSALSFMTVAELRAGALLANWGIRRMGIMEDFIRQFEIIHSDDDICGY